MPQPLQPLPQLQELPQPHFPEQHDDIFELGWGWKAGDGEDLIGFLLDCLLAGLRNNGMAVRLIYRREEEDEDDGKGR